MPTIDIGRMSDPERYHPDVSGLSGDRKRFRDRWSPVRSLESGNQGLAYEAIDAAGIRAFVKEFRPNQGSERRARFCREVRILAGLAITGIPRLLESNGEHFADSSFELYLATEYIDGVRLSNLVNAGLEPLGAIDLVLQVCTVVSAAHTVGVLHRDIKPDNVMVVQSGYGLVAHVVDFGMAHIEEAPSDFRTHSGQEAGNRFLRLPEYASGSDNKRDFRSDITFCVGLLFFALTKTKPATLVDHYNLHPHQRPRMRDVLAQCGLDLGRLLAVFDVGFANDIGKRYQSFEALMDDLQRLRDSQPSPSTDPAASAQRLRDRYMTPERLSQRDIEKETRDILVFVNTVLDGIAEECGGVLQIGLSNLRTERDSATGDFTVADPSDPFRKFSMTALAQTVGAEHVLTVTCEEDGLALRFAVGSSVPVEELNRFRAFLHVRIDEATSDEHFTTPRPLQASPYHPFADGEKPAGWWLPEEEATFEYRPLLSIAWYRPHTRAGRPIISWSFTNVGSGIADDVRFSFPFLALDAVPEIHVGETVTFERRFDERAAYYDIMKGVVQGFVEFSDRAGHLYRQSVVAHGRPAQRGWDPDYYTTQFGYPFLTDFEQRMVQLPEDGYDPGYRTQSMRDLFDED